MSFMVLNLGRIDLHIHTNFSDGSCSVKEAITTSRKKGFNTFAITDHYSEFKTVPKRMSKSQLNPYLDELKKTEAVKGVEVDILPDGVSISRQSASLCDLVLGGLHTLHDRVFWYDKRPIWNPRSFVEDVRVTLIKAMESNLLDVLVHVTWLPEDIRPQMKQLITKDWIKSVVNVASNHEVAIELSGVWKIPEDSFVRECLRKGVKLSIGSDAHNLSMIGNVKYATDLLERVKASSESIFLPRRSGEECKPRK